MRAIVATLLFALPLLGCAAGGATLNLGGERLGRSLIDRPAAASGPGPVVLFLHGAIHGPGTMRDMLRSSGGAQAPGVTIVYPNAEGMIWNEGSLAEALPGVLARGDDIAFLDRLIASLVEAGIADPAAIHLAGFSNGAMMAARYACLHAERVASLTLFQASMPREEEAPCRPARPLDVMLVAGTEDPIMRWDGRIVAGRVVTLQRRLSVPESFELWLRLNRCAGQAEPVALPRQGVPSAPFVLAHAGTGCANGVRTLLYEVRGGGHRLPGQDGFSFRRIFGRATGDVAASELVTRFALRRSELPGVAR